MTAEFSIKSQLDFKIKLKEINDRIKKNLEKALEEEVSYMVQRATEGKDANDKPFSRAYSENYAKAKKFATGRGDKVDLIGFNYKRKDGRPSASKRTQPGAMLNSMTSRITVQGRTGLLGRIFFRTPKESAKARGNQELRNWFGLSKKQLSRILKRLNGD